MSTVQVELKPLAELFAKTATEEGWCSEAEEVFEDATRVTFLHSLRTCGSERCNVCRMAPGQPARFTLPADAPKFVPEAPIIEILKDRFDDAQGCDYQDCCGYCGDPDMRKALLTLALALPSKPDLT